jgi:K+-sensing histidine kinase KdpD
MGDAVILRRLRSDELKCRILIEIKAAKILLYKAIARVANRHSTCSTRADGEEESAMYKHILIPTDGSELSNKAIQHGVALAKAVNAKVMAITVSTPFHIMGSSQPWSPTHQRVMLNA